MIKYSIIIPVFNAEKYIVNCINTIRSIDRDCQIIVSDGGSGDRTLTLLEKMNVAVVSSPKGRGIQLNEGAKRAQGEILFFLHVDTLITKEFFLVVDRYFQNHKVKVGKCSLRFDQSNGLLSFYSYIAKFDSLMTSFGDQGIVVRRKFFEDIGGFPQWSLLEDVAFFQKARRLTRIYTLPTEVITSAERFTRNGIVCQQLFNAKIIIKYLLGASPDRLALEYENFRRKK